MKLMLASLLALAVLFGETAAARMGGKYGSVWESYKANHGLSFQNTASEIKAYTTYSQNMDYISNWNANPKNTFTLKDNQFTHLSTEEMRSQVLMPSRSASQRAASVGGHPAAAPKVGMTLKTLVNYTDYFGPAKDQGYCGSCYTFAATGVVEAQFAMTYGGMITLSEEQILDCTYNPSDPASSPNQGCNGGDDYYTFSYVRQTGLCAESDYPYSSSNIEESGTSGFTGECKENVIAACNPVKIKNYGIVTAGDEMVLAGFLQLFGPVTIYVDASPMSFSFYKSGIYNDATCSNMQTNHAVVAVGFGSLGPGQDFWIVRNSWSPSWGMNGYIWIARNMNDTCGVASSPIYAHFS